MDPLTGSALVGSGFGLLGSGVSAIANHFAQKQQNEFNLEMWNKQNEYNSPEQQMARFQKAGLSPQLVYGNGTSGNATSAPQMGSTIPAEQIGSSVGNAVNMIQALQNLQKSQEDVNQSKIASFVDYLHMQEYAAQLSARAAATGDNFLHHAIWLNPFGKKFFPADADAVPGVEEYYKKLYEAGLHKSSGQGRYWRFRGDLADKGLSEKDNILWRLFIGNAPELNKSIGRITGTIDELLAEGTDTLWSKLLKWFNS